MGIVKWIRGEGSLYDMIPPGYLDWESYGWAAEGGHLDVLKWVRSQDPPCPWDEGTCQEAAEGGHLEVLKWLRAQNPRADRLHQGMAISTSSIGSTSKRMRATRNFSTSCRISYDMTYTTA